MMGTAEKARAVAKMRREEAERVAYAFVELLEPYTERIEIAGSIRRGELEVGDVEIVCIPKPFVDLCGPNPSRPHQVKQALEQAGATPRLKTNGHRVAWGQRFMAAELNGYMLDVFCVMPPAQWGTILAIRTGPADYSQWLVTEARRRGRVFEDGRLVKVSGAVIPTPEEEDVFKALGLPFVEPADRSSGSRSACCAAPLRVAPEGGHEATRYYVCTHCGRPA